MTGHPTLSIIVPIYGVEKYIAKFAHSLLGQTYANVQFIFVNDGTKDKSIDILENIIEDFKISIAREATSSSSTRKMRVCPKPEKQD